MKYIIDRIEENFAIVELSNKTMVNIPLAALPPEIKEGDVVSITIDQLETNTRKARIATLAKSLFAD